MANPNSSIFYSRSKGLTEQALAELGYADTIIFRPGALANTQRAESRFAERTFLYALSVSFIYGRSSSLTLLLRAVTGILSRFSPSIEIGVSSI